MSSRPLPLAGVALPALALMFNAFAWGVSWWPFRELQARGLHPLWATVIIYALAVVGISLWRPQSWRELARAPALWVVLLASGTTNATFNWAVTIGDVVRVVLLFYLMPLWAVLLARALLGEPLRLLALVRVLIALTGAAIVLWPVDAGGAAHAAGATPRGGWPMPRSLAEWLGVVGGFCFALNNVMLRREADRPEAARALAMFVGGCAVSAVVALGLGAQGSVPWPPAAATGWIAGTALLALFFVASNLALQYGASRLPAHVTAVVMVTEVLFASVSAVLLGAAQLSVPLIVGGVLIVGAALLAARH
jgi:drug/metabolite transporter (DMT)-like permease